MLLFLITLLAVPLVSNGLSFVGKFSCPVDEVLGFVQQNETEIDMNAIPAPICGQMRVREPSKNSV